MRPVFSACLALAAAICLTSAAAGADDGEPVPGDRLATAIDSGSVSAVRRVLDEGVSPDTLVYEATPLMWAIWDDRYYVAKLLIDRGADVNLPDENGYTSLMAACNMGNLRMAKLLLDEGADVNAVELTYGTSALQSCCEGGNEAVFDLLIKRGADVQHIDKYGGNSLEEAAFYGSKAIVAKLRDKGLATKWPLHIACGLGEVETVERLLATGSEANQPNEGWQNTPLHFAAGGGHVDVGKRLSEQGAALDAKNVLGATPLHVAAGAEQLDFAKWLVDQGVDVNAADHEGFTPLDWAGEKTYEFIRQHGGEHQSLEADGSATSAN